MKKLLLAFGFALLVCGRGTAVTDEQSSVDRFNTKAISLAVKICIKAYLTNADFQSLKNEKLTAIKRKPAPQFEADYNQAWVFLKKCPNLVSKYRLRQNMTKPEILKIVGRLTRDDCLEAVDNIPDEVIVDQFNKCVNDPEMKNKSLNEQVDLIMKR